MATTARRAKRNSSAAEVDFDLGELAPPAFTSSLSPTAASADAATASATATRTDAATDATADAATGDGDQGPPRKRKRRVVSCAECHRRKQKCDRNQPCQACVDRKMEASCHYETTAMSHERHHMRVIEAAAFGRALQASSDNTTGSLPIKAASFGYVQSTDNTLAFLGKIESGPRRGGRARVAGGAGCSGGSGGSGVGGIGSTGAYGDSAFGSFSSDGSPDAPVMALTPISESERHYLQAQPQTLLVQGSQQPQQHNPQPSEVQLQLEPESSLPAQLGPVYPVDSYGVTDRYRALTRELPSRQYIDQLVTLYMREFNWQYYPLEEDVFLKQLNQWVDMAMGSFGMLQPPHKMSPDLRAFPALLFQVLAIALVVVAPGEPSEFVQSLKRPSHDSLEALAMDYSEAGMSILSLLGKRQLSLTSVSSSFLRCMFLKYISLVTESWHALGSTIRDAQEIGLHRRSLDPKPWAQTAEAVLANEWEIQRRRRLWMYLISWDVQMGIVLGRPTSIDTSVKPILPVDCILPMSSEERATMGVQVRGENDPPTPLTRAIWAYSTTVVPLLAILDLEKEGPMPRDFSVVDKLHREQLRLLETAPPYFRLENPDTRFDDLPSCSWLAASRVVMPQSPIFNLIALHRHYIFTRPRSRTEGLRACLALLNIHRVYFSTLKPHQYKTFSLFFGTFDSLVLMASIYILFPKEHPELVPEAIQHFRWSVERFQLMADYYGLVRSALGVLQAIYLRLRKALGIHFLEGDDAVVGTAPIDPLTLSNIDPSLKDEKHMVGGVPSTTMGCIYKLLAPDSPAAGSDNLYSASSSGGAGSASAGNSVSELTPGTASTTTSWPSTAASDVYGGAGTALKETSEAEAGAEAGASAVEVISAPTGMDSHLDLALEETSDVGQAGRAGQADQADQVPVPMSVQEPGHDRPETAMAGTTDDTGAGAGVDMADLSIFPDGFDWMSFEPMCPTGDLTYNILMGVSEGALPLPLPLLSADMPAAGETGGANGAAGIAGISGISGTAGIAGMAGMSGMGGMGGTAAGAMGDLPPIWGSIGASAGEAMGMAPVSMMGGGGGGSGGGGGASASAASSASSAAVVPGLEASALMGVKSETMRAGQGGEDDQGSTASAEGDVAAAAAAAAAATSIDGTAVPWQFEGDFTNNSLWGLLNSVSPF